MTEEVTQSMEPVEKTSAVVAPSGISGLNRGAGLGLVEEEFLPELRGRLAIDKYTEMWMNDAIASAMLFAIDMFMRRTAWRAEAAGDEPRFQEDQQFLSECMDDMSHTWQDLIAEINSMLAYGWSFLELLYKRRTTEVEDDTQDPPSKFNDNKIGWRKIEIRSQTSFDRWAFDDEGGIAGMYQRPAPDYVERFIPIQKALLFRTTSRRNSPEGVSVLRSAYRSYYYKKRIEEIEGVGIERDLAGLPMAEVPASMLRPNASDAEKAMLQSILKLVGQVRRDQTEGVVWPVEYDGGGNKLFSFSLLSASGSRQFSTSDVITRYEQRMAMTVLADFILLGNADTSGSFAMSTTKSGMFQSALSAWMDGIEAVLNNYAVPRLFRLNGRPGPYPKIRHEDVQKPSIADLATFVSAMVGAGAQLFPDVELENALRETAKLPLRGEALDQKNKEDVFRDQKVDTDIEVARAQAKQAKEGIVPAGAGGPNPLGKQPDAVPGAPTPSTGEVRSKLPPRQRRTTAAVNAAANVRKVIIQKKERNSKKPQSCKYCSNPAKKSLLWAEGMAYIPACEKHEKKARAQIVIANRDEVAAVHDVRQK